MSESPSLTKGKSPEEAAELAAPAATPATEESKALDEKQKEIGSSQVEGSQTSQTPDEVQDNDKAKGDDGKGISDDEDEPEEGEIENPPLPPEDPPLPPGPPPGEPNDGWEAIWDQTAGAYYFYNHFTGVTTWDNPRIPPGTEATAAAAAVQAHPPGVAPSTYSTYHGTETYDGSAGVLEDGSENNLTLYQLQHGITDPSKVTAEDIADSYLQTAKFNRFTGKFQNDRAPEDYNDENKARRQMSFYFDVDAAANSHDGKSLRAERQQRKLSKKEVKAFKEKRREKKEQKRRAWLKD